MFNSKKLVLSNVASPSAGFLGAWQRSISRQASTEAQKSKVVVIGGGGFLGILGWLDYC